MDFKDQVLAFCNRVAALKDNLSTEEATKTALIMPLIQILGYDVFNPLEVVPEFVCDIGTKKGEKVDYAIMDSDRNPIILIECKHWSQALTLHDNQLLRYFHVTKARFGILTNGLVYRFYTDLEEANIMDSIPFLEINFLDLRENQIEELRKFHKAYFDIQSIVSSASDLKYTNAIKLMLKKEFADPSESFAKTIAKMVYSGTLTQKMLEYFSGIIPVAFNHYIGDIITEKLNSAFPSANIILDSSGIDKKSNQETNSNAEPIDSKPLTTTTPEEMEGFYIVKSILRQKVDADRIFYKDAQSYFAINFDNNVRKPICRLYFNNPARKVFCLFTEDKKEIRHEIKLLDDIYKFEDDLIQWIETYLDK